MAHSSKKFKTFDQVSSILKKIAALACGPSSSPLAIINESVFKISKKNYS